MSGFSFKNIKELRLSMVCISLNQRGQVLKEAAIETKVVAALLFHHLGDTETGKKKIQQADLQT